MVTERKKLKSAWKKKTASLRYDRCPTRAQLQHFVPILSSLRSHPQDSRIRGQEILGGGIPCGVGIEAAKDQLRIPRAEPIGQARLDTGQGGDDQGFGGEHGCGKGIDSTFDEQ